MAKSIIPSTLDSEEGDKATLLTSGMQLSSRTEDLA
ncbi:hypothetical protein COLO4_26693 [Corchorus olitorius]|uniref:Uncharacterized protein n=1 Tax=Corchorus olitorius TaxID=93759 RepID=A0A1R3HVC3_9ROSI|nr:hypothetical protein COLO4_26693 [Corchorus olitorius]